jgi:hypothetical protein
VHFMFHILHFAVILLRTRFHQKVLSYLNAVRLLRSRCYEKFSSLLALLPGDIAESDSDEHRDGDAHSYAHPDDLLIDAAIAAT